MMSIGGKGVDIFKKMKIVDVKTHCLPKAFASIPPVLSADQTFDDRRRYILELVGKVKTGEGFP